MLGLPAPVFTFIFSYEGWKKLVALIIVETCIYYIIAGLARSRIASDALGLSESSIDHALFALHLMLCLPPEVQVIELTMHLIILRAVMPPSMQPLGLSPLQTQVEMLERMRALLELEFSLYELDFPQHAGEEESSDDVGAMAYLCYWSNIKQAIASLDGLD